ncbi:VCBS repeat-containing protein [Pelagibius sp.]|uniref:FG-GAP repeat domain-containing protein n=1 Tax=Pelagibius sp. TaxID=1931238 RepID=UPI002635F30D|nr:VCBS repeat-containing protein [Pelagibius sp.]
MRAFALGLALGVAVAGPASADDLEALGFRPLVAEAQREIEIDLRAVSRPGNALPDGQPALGRGAIAEVWLTEPTERYGHAVLGDGIEAGGLLVRRADGDSLTLSLPEAQVFEDLTPRLVDLDGDGRDEILVVRSSQSSGAMLVAYGVVEGALRAVAKGPERLTAHRWLNPVGAADFDGDGVLEVAYVETPHIGGVLRIFSRQGDRLVQEAEAYGFSNHAIGSRALVLSAILDADGDGLPEILLPDARRRALRVVGFVDGALRERAVLALDAQIVGDFRLADLDGNGLEGVVIPLSGDRELRLYR